MKMSWKRQSTTFQLRFTSLMDVQALGGPLLDFLDALPHFEVMHDDEGQAVEAWESTRCQARARMQPEAPEDLVPLGGTHSFAVASAWPKAL